MIKHLLRSFAGGEIAPELHGRVDLPKFQTGLETCKNFTVLPHGPVARRPGTKFVLEAKDSTRKVRLIPFQFSATQSMVLEFGHQYIRFHTEGGTLLETALTVTGITQANPGVLTYTGADPANGDWMYLASIGGMTQLNGRFVKVAGVNTGANTFQLTDMWGTNINTTSFGAYTSGGTAARVYTLASPYVEEDLFDLHYTQSADVITIVHPTYAARELARNSATIACDNVTFTGGGSANIVYAGADVTSLGARVYFTSTSALPTEITAGVLYYVRSIDTGTNTITVATTASGTAITFSGAGTGVHTVFWSGWSLSTISFAPPSNAPTGVAATPTGSGGSPQDHKYVVTAVAADGVTESLPSAVATGNVDLTVSGNYITVSWSAVEGSSRYNVYKLRGGIYGYIGQIIADTGGGVNISSISRSGHVITCNTVLAHSVVVSDVVYISGTGVTSLDGTYYVMTVPDTDTFTCYSYLTTTVSSTTGRVTDTSGALSIKDDNVTPDTLYPPPSDIIDLNGEENEYPACVTYHEQRRWFGGTNNGPQVLWSTRIGTEANLTSSIPSRDADAMEIKIWATQYNRVKHLVALTDLIALTAAAEFRVFSDGAPAITPTSISVKPQGYSGSSNVQPVVTSASILFVQAQGGKVRELTYSWESASYRTSDTTLLAPHRFHGYTIAELAYSRAPDQILWAVRSDGTLLGMTYVPDQQVYGWHHHVTDGTIESVCVVSEDDQDVPYLVVKRNVNSRDVRYIERMQSRLFTDLEDAFYVDAGLTYSGSPATNVTGLWHLEGETVSILADGAVAGTQVVTAGTLPTALSTAASKIHIGLGYTSDIQTLPLSIEGAQAAAQGTVKNVNKIHLRVAQSSLVKAGPSFSRLREYPARAITDPYGSPPALRDGELSMLVDAAWSQTGALCIRQSDPLPLTLVSVTLEAQSGG